MKDTNYTLSFNLDILDKKEHLDIYLQLKREFFFDRIQEKIQSSNNFLLDRPSLASFLWESTDRLYFVSENKHFEDVNGKPKTIVKYVVLRNDVDAYNKRIGIK